MTSEVLVSIITGVFTLLGVIITVVCGNKKQAKNTNDYKNMTIYRIEQLEKKQDKHNNLMERVFKLEGNVSELTHEMKSVRQHIVNDNK